VTIKQVKRTRAHIGATQGYKKEKVKKKTKNLREGKDNVKASS
jgi:hypothetical protein